MGDTWTDTPAGVAHYLEHKLFDMPDGSDALLTLSENGADPNAFTSTNMTAYYFSCTDGFEENLRTLLRFVSTPYFTDASVAKEQGIIAQEIRMGEDDPDRAVWRNLMRCLMARDGARDAVAGTVESIAEITPETLYACHRAFYAPSNMVLCAVCQDTPERVAAIAAEILPPEAEEGLEKCLKEHGEALAPGALTDSMVVPLLRSGFRMVVFSVVIMIIVLFFSKGIMGEKELSWKGIGGLLKKRKKAAPAAEKED
mgnify:CR=1 FL=1